MVGVNYDNPTAGLCYTDEFPNYLALMIAINVVNDMGTVGGVEMIFRFVAHLEKIPYYVQRHCVNPGRPLPAHAAAPS